MTLVTRYLAPFTGPDAATLPKFPPYSVGADDFTQRWVAAQAPAGPITSWMSCGPSPVALTGTAITKETGGATGDVMQFLPAGGGMINAGLAWKTFVMVVKPTGNPASWPVCGADVFSSLNWTPTSLLSNVTGGSIAVAGVVPHFAFVAMRVDAGNTAAWLEGLKSGPSGTMTPTGAVGLRIGASFAGGSPMDAEVNEIVIWNRALSDTDIATVRAAMKVAYQTLP